MANKKTTFNHETDVVTFTQADMEVYANANATIIDCQNRAEGLAQTIAGQLYIVSQKELYKLDDYKTVHDWAMDKHQIAKGTVSDSINTFARFGDGTTGNLLPKYEEYTFSTLMRMKSLTDEQIELAGINPTMSRTQVVDAIKALKVLEDKQKELPKFEKEWENTYKKYVELEPDTDARLKVISALVPEFFNDSYVKTVTDYESLIEGIDAIIEVKDKVNELYYLIDTLESRMGVEEATKFIQAADSGYSIVDGIRNCADISDIDKVIDIINQYLDDTQDEEQEEQEENSTVEQQAVDEEPEEESEQEKAPESMPTKTLNINHFRSDKGNLLKKELLDAVWHFIQEVDNGEIDLVVIKAE